MLLHSNYILQCQRVSHVNVIPPLAPPAKIANGAGFAIVAFDLYITRSIKFVFD
jgi:hypothetical protein